MSVACCRDGEPECGGAEGVQCVQEGDVWVESGEIGGDLCEVTVYIAPQACLRKARVWVFRRVVRRVVMVAGVSPKMMAL